MKTRSVLLVAGLATVVAVVGLGQRARVLRLTEEYRTERERAAALGLAVDPDGSGALAATTARSRPEAAAGEKVQFLLKELPGSIAKGPRAVYQNLRGLSGPELQILCADLATTAELTPEQRTTVARALVRDYVSLYPEMMLRLYASVPDYYTGQAGAPALAAEGLKQWAVSNPARATAWAREMEARAPGLITPDAWQELLAGTARIDPALALSQVAALKMGDDPQAWGRLGETLKTPEQRTALLAAARNYRSAAEGSPDDEAHRKAADATLAGLARSVVAEDYDEAAKWLAGAGLTQAEKETFAGELHPWFTKAESGRWLDWLGDNLSGAPLSDKSGEIMAEWARKDYAAAGTWLGSRQPGPLRDAAIQSYATAVAPYEPAAASEWALLLPGGAGRTETLRTIYQEWTARDPAAAAAFARRANLSGP